MSNSMWQLHRYGRQWAIWDTRTRAFVLFGPKREMQARLGQLQKGA
jgi:hypothetical protein